MGFTGWVTQNWFTLLQTAGIVGSLWYAARSFRFDAKVRRVGNLFAIIDHHRQIWSRLYSRPELGRIKDSEPDLEHVRITREEELFVTQVILHLSGVYSATKEGVITPLDGAEADIEQFFSNPIPCEVWRRKRRFQDSEFREYLDARACKSPHHN